MKTAERIARDLIAVCKQHLKSSIATKKEKLIARQSYEAGVRDALTAVKAELGSAVAARKGVVTLTLSEIIDWTQEDT